MYQWRYIDTIWFIIISTTTIGLGDIALDKNRPGVAMFELLVIGFGVILVALAIGVLVTFYESEVELMEERAAKIQKKMAKIVPGAVAGAVHKVAGGEETERETEKETDDGASGAIQLAPNNNKSVVEVQPINPPLLGPSVTAIATLEARLGPPEFLVSGTTRLRT